MTSGTSQQFCVRWNSHLGSLGAAFPQLLAGQRFVDVTLACEGHQLHCHRLVLAACSTYFESLLGENPCKHPIIILPHDIKLWEIQALVDFMYKGEVNVSQAGLSDLLKCAEILQIRGLCGSEAGVNMNQANPTTTITDGTTSTASASTTASSTAGTTTNNQSNTIPNLITNPLSINSQNSNNNDRSENDSPTNHNPIQQEISSAVLSASSTSAIINNSSIGNVNSSRKSSIHQQQSHSNDSSQLRKLKIEQQLYRTSPNRSVQKIEPVDVSMDDDLDDDDSVNPAMDKTDDDSISGKYLDYLEATKSENQHNLTQTQQQDHEHVTTFPRSLSTTSYLNNNNNICNYNAIGNDDENRDCNGENLNQVTIVNDENENCGQSSVLLKKFTPILPDRDGNGCGIRRNNFRGKIRVKSNENLFGDITKTKKQPSSSFAATALRSKTRREQSSTSTTATTTTTTISSTHSNRPNVRILPSSLRFNRESMTIFLKSEKEDEKITSRKNLESEKSATEDFLNVPIKTEYDLIDENNFESIICSPNVMEIAYNNVHDSGGEGCDDVGEVDGEVTADYDSSPIILDSVDDDIKINNDIGYSGTNSTIMPALLQYTETNSSDQENNHFNAVSTYDHHYGRANENICPIRFVTNKFDSTNSNGTSSVGVGAGGAGIGGMSIRNRSSLTSADDNDGYSIEQATNVEDVVNGDGMEPSLRNVILRNPRNNQPRTYSNDALYNALMDVKGGESIYRASQIHKVPRKTLRNWMKRWHIKSAYPMPRQLKQAAEKKKRIQQLGNSNGEIDPSISLITASHTRQQRGNYDIHPFK